MCSSLQLCARLWLISTTYNSWSDVQTVQFQLCHNEPGSLSNSPRQTNSAMPSPESQNDVQRGHSKEHMTAKNPVSTTASSMQNIYSSLMHIPPKNRVLSIQEGGTLLFIVTGIKTEKSWLIYLIMVHDSLVLKCDFFNWIAKHNNSQTLRTPKSFSLAFCFLLFLATDVSEVRSMFMLI